MFNPTLRTALLGSGAAIALMAGPALAGQTEDLKAQIDQLQSRLDQLEKQQATTDAKVAAAPADAVVGGDFPGSFKLPGSDTSVAIHGYTKLDFIYDFDQALGDTFDVSAIASPHSPSQRKDGAVHLGARQSRLHIETRTPTNYGQLQTVLEMDFFGAAGTQFTNNSNGMRMRHAYGVLGPVLAGQTWTNFMDVADGPELLDFGGGAGAPSKRQAQVRYTQAFGKFTASASAENPADVGRPAAGGAGEITAVGGTAPATNPTMPDLTAALEYTDGWGHVKASGVLRRLQSDNGLGGSGPSAGTRLRDDAMGYGGNIGASVNWGQWVGGYFAQDQLGVDGYYGTGIGDYLIPPNQGIGQMTFLEPTASGVRLINTPGEGGQAWLAHHWTDQLRSNFVYGISHWTFPAALTPTTAQSNTIQTAYVNLIWSPVKSVNFGLEFMYGNRLMRAADTGGGSRDTDAKRLMASMQYVF